MASAAGTAQYGRGWQTRGALLGMEENQGPADGDFIPWGMAGWEVWGGKAITLLFFVIVNSQ